MVVDLTRAGALRQSIASAWAAEARPRCEVAIEDLPPDTNVVRAYYCDRDWRDVDFADPRSTFTGLVTFTNSGLRYYIAAFLTACLDIDERVRRGQPCFAGDVLACFDTFVCNPNASERVAGATPDQIGCILGTAIFIRDYQGFYHPGFLDYQRKEWDEAIARWSLTWAAQS